MSHVENESKEKYEALMLLEPSSPFTTYEVLDRAVEMMELKNANFITGMKEVGVASVFMGSLDPEGRMTSIIDKMATLSGLRRQDVVQEYTMNGGFYLIKWDYFKKVKHRYRDRLNSYGIVVPWQYSVEIDEPSDLAYAEFLVKEKFIDMSFWR